jgi:hypothetical protein
MSVLRCVFVGFAGKEQYDQMNAVDGFDSYTGRGIFLTLLPPYNESSLRELATMMQDIFKHRWRDDSPPLRDCRDWR